MRDQLPVLFAALAVLLLGALGYSLLFGQDEAVQLEVLDVDGGVERIDAKGGRTTAQAGDMVGAKERVTVGESGRAVLGIGEGTRLTLEAESTIQVTQVEKNGVRVELEEGRVQAKVSSGSTVLGIARGQQAVTVGDGEVVVGADGDVLTVEARDGSAELEGFDGLAELAAGNRVVAGPDGVSDALPVPAEMLLDVAWPEKAATREDELAIVGKAEPLVRVRARSPAGEAEGRAGQDGAFRLVVPLQEGPNDILVMVDDRLGRTRRSTHSVVLDTKAPQATQAEVVWQ